MTEEFELTYLVKELPVHFSTNVRSKEIVDIYIPASMEHPILRVRKRGDVYEITKKTAGVRGRFVAPDREYHPPYKRRVCRLGKRAGQAGTEDALLF